MSDEWGPWIEHDGRGCPCVGMFVHAQYDEKHFGGPGPVVDEFYGIAGIEGGESWDWAHARWCFRVIRYRIRKPRGMTVLESLLADLPERVDA